MLSDYLYNNPDRDEYWGEHSSEYDSYNGVNILANEVLIWVEDELGRSLVSDEWVDILDSAYADFSWGPMSWEPESPDVY